MTNKSKIKIAIGLLLILVALILKAFLPHLGPTLHLSAFLWWMVLLAAAWGQGTLLGSLILRDIPLTNPEMKTALLMGLGFGALSLEVYLLGLAGFFTTRAITVLIIASLLITVFTIRKDTTLRFAWTAELDRGSQIPLTLMGIGGLVILLFALVPPVFFDAMTYHLELPSRYLQEARVFHVAENLYSGYPQIVEILFGAGLALDGMVLAGMISLMFMLLTMLLLWGWGKSRFGEVGTAWGIALLVLTPPFMVIVGFFENGWGSTFFTLAVIALLAENERKPGIMILAGIMAGLAAGCKYNALGFAVAAPLGAGIWVDFRDGRSFRWQSWSLFLLSAMIVVSPWYLKNMYFTGDPLYPLLHGIAGKIPGFDILVADTHHHTLSYRDLWEWVTVPYIAFFKPHELQLWLHPGWLPIALLPTLGYLRGSGTGSRFLGTWAILYFLIWYVSFRSGRFLIPVLAVGFLFMGTGLARFLSTGSRWGSPLQVFVVLMLLVNIGAFKGFEAEYANRTEAAFGMMGGREYLLDNYPPFPAIEYLNNLQPLPGRVLFLGEMRGFYSRFPREVPTFEMPHRLMEMVKSRRSADEMARELAAAGFTHILYHPREMKRLAAKSHFLRIDDEGAARLSEFLNIRGRVLFMEKGIYVIALQ